MDPRRLARIEYQMRSDFEANMVGMASLRDSINAVKKAVRVLKRSVRRLDEGVSGTKSGIDLVESTTRAYYEHMIQGFSELRKEHEGLDARVTRLEEGPS